MPTTTDIAAGERTKAKLRNFAFSLTSGKELFWHSPSSLRMYDVEEMDGKVVVTL